MRGRRAIFFALGLGVLASPLRVLAVVIGGDPTLTNTNLINASEPAGLPGWNYVGSVNGASGIFLGGNWVLTAEHVGVGSTFTLNGIPYPRTGFAKQLVNPFDNSLTDMVLFQIKAPINGTLPDLPDLSLATTTPQVNTPYTNVGFGFERNSALLSLNSNFMSTNTVPPTYQGYGFGPPGVKSWGTNTVFNFGTMSDPIALAEINAGFGNIITFAGNFDADSDQIVRGDSGGAAFNAQGQLIGMNDVMSAYDGQPTQEALFGNQSYMADIAFYAQEISSIDLIPLPEPSSVGLLALAGLSLLRRPMRRG